MSTNEGWRMGVPTHNTCPSCGQYSWAKPPDHCEAKSYHVAPPKCAICGSTAHVAEEYHTVAINKKRKETVNMLQIPESGDACFGKAFLKGEPTFTLRGQDKTAVAVIDYWLKCNPQINEEKRAEVVAIRQKMASWEPQKAAD